MSLCFADMVHWHQNVERPFAPSLPNQVRPSSKKKPLVVHDSDCMLHASIHHEFSIPCLPKFEHLPKTKHWLIILIACCMLACIMNVPKRFTLKTLGTLLTQVRPSFQKQPLDHHSDCMRHTSIHHECSKEVQHRLSCHRLLVHQAMPRLGMSSCM